MWRSKQFVDRLLLRFVIWLQCFSLLSYLTIFSTIGRGSAMTKKRKGMEMVNIRKQISLENFESRRKDFSVPYLWRNTSAKCNQLCTLYPWGVYCWLPFPLTSLRGEDISSLLNTNSESQPSKKSTSECRILFGWKMASQSSRYQHGINALYVGDHDIRMVPICSSLISRRMNQNQND